VETTPPSKTKEELLIPETAGVESPEKPITKDVATITNNKTKRAATEDETAPTKQPFSNAFQTIHDSDSSHEVPHPQPIQLDDLMS
jgi:hypothetical protein